MSETNSTRRSPVIAVMGHVDHGKSTLLDYIRKTNTVDAEAGGITQHLSAYEAVHKDESGDERKITFIDTPGHEAFSKMRVRGADVADIIILVVAADDAVKPQTVEALEVIKESKTPFVVAINKIDKNGADIEKVKTALLEHEVYVEGYGGDTPWIGISAKTGEGIPDLLDTLILVSDLEDFKGSTNLPAEGVIIESHRDPKIGIVATLIIKNGSIKKGQFVVSDHACVSTRMLTDYAGKSIDFAQFSSPVVLTGWNDIPPVGSTFKTFDKKKEADKACELDENNTCLLTEKLREIGTHETKQVPLIIKTDVAGTFEAVEKELCKLQRPEISFKLIYKGVGNISETDVRFAKADSDVIILGFNVKADKNAVDVNEQIGATIQTFNIIYELTDWAEKELETRRPRKDVDEVHGQMKVMRIFSRTKDRQVIGGEMKEGSMSTGDRIKIVRRKNEIENGKIVGMQQAKIEVKSVQDGQFGMMVEAKLDIAEGDVIEAFKVVNK